MLLDIKEFKKIVLGTIATEVCDGYFRLLRFSKSQFDFYENLGIEALKRANSTASVKMEFYTNGGEISFDYRILPGIKREYYSIDLLVDGVYKYNISEDTNKAENTFKYSVPLSSDKKRVTVYFPTTSELQIKNVVLPDDFIPHKRDKKALALGDSKYQGYNPNHFQNTCMNVFSDYFDLNLINQSVGGEMFRSEMIEKVVENPEFIVVGYGINDWATGNLKNGENAKEFLVKLNEIYPDEKIFFILPSDSNYLEKKRENKDITTARSGVFDKSTINDVRNILNNVCKEFKNVIPINAKDFVPQYKECFYTDNIHYSDLGNILFANELIKAITGQ